MFPSFNLMSKIEKKIFIYKIRIKSGLNQHFYHFHINFNPGGGA